MVTLRDHTELRALVSELKTIRGFAEALSAQAHESANQLQTVISLIELGRAEEALRFAATELAVAQHLTDVVVGAIGEPELAALVLGKAAEAGERGVELWVDDDIDMPAGVADPRDLVTIVGNLLDNAVDAAAADAGAALGPAGGRDADRRRGRGAGDRRRRQRPGAGPRRRGARVRTRLDDQADGPPARPRHRPGPGGAGRPPARRVRSTVVNEVGAVFTVRLPRRRAAPPPEPAVSPGRTVTARIAVDVPA